MRRRGGLVIRPRGAGKRPKDKRELLGWPAVVPAPNWPSYAAFATQTETRINRSATASNLPVSFRLNFHQGSLPTTKTLQLRDPSNNIVATTDWQWGERSTFNDGSLRSCVVRCYGPASWATDASKQWTVEAITGAWPAESDSKTTSDITNASTVKIELTNVRKIGSIYDSNQRIDQVAWDNPKLTFDLNRSLARAVTRKRTGGAIFTQYVTWEKLRDPDTNNEDTQVWCKCWVGVWFAPSSSTVRHISIHPLLINGWARVTGRAKVFHLKVVNGGVTLRDFSQTLSVTNANFQTYGDFTGDATDFTTFEFRQGCAVEIGGDVPSGLTVGKYHQVGYYADGGGTAGELYQRPKLILHELGSWKGIDGSSPNSRITKAMLGTGGGTFTLQGAQYLVDQNQFAIRDKGGECLWAVGGALIEPNWTYAEKIYRMQTLLVPPVPIEPSDPNFGEANDVGIVPAYLQNHAFTPGGTVLHRSDMETAGEWYQGGYHLNECSYWMKCVLNEMGTSRQWLRQQRMAAAEAISFQNYAGAYENATDGSGNEYAINLVLNNGPAGNGVAYSNMPPCKPTATILNLPTGSTNGIYAAGGEAVLATQENEWKHASYGGLSGSHNAKDYIYSEAMYCDPSDLEIVSLAHTTFVIRVPNSGNARYGRNKTYNGRTYYGVTIVGHNGGGLQPRAWIGMNLMLAQAQLIPDSEPNAQYFRDLARDNVEYLEAIYADSNIMGQRAKNVTPMISLNAGLIQTWQSQRHATTSIMLTKMSGLTAPNCVKFLTAQSRLFWGHPVNGTAPPQNGTGWLGDIAMGSYFDKVKQPIVSGYDADANAGDTDPTITLTRFMDDATYDATAGNMTWNSPAAIGGLLRFHSDGVTARIEMNTSWAVTHAPLAGDQIQVPGNNSPTLQTGLTYGIWYYVYDVTTYSGDQKQFKLSSTPGPSFTPVTWTAGTERTVNSDSFWYYYATKRLAGGGAMLNHSNGANASRDYLHNITGPMLVANTVFGTAAGCNAAVASYAAFKAAVRSEQSINIEQFPYSGYSWCAHAAYPFD